MRRLTGIGLAILLLSAAPASAAGIDPAALDKMVSGLNITGTHPTDNIWSLQFGGNKFAHFDVHIVLSDDHSLTVFFVILATKDTFTPDADFLMAITKMNAEMDRVKLVLDEDGDLIMRSDVSSRVLDADEVKLEVSQIAAGADEAYGRLKIHDSAK